VRAGAKTKGVQGKLKIVGFGQFTTLIEDMQVGAIDSLVVQNPSAWATRVKALIDKLTASTGEAHRYRSHRRDYSTPEASACRSCSIPNR